MFINNLQKIMIKLAVTGALPYFKILSGRRETMFKFGMPIHNLPESVFTDWKVMKRF